MKMYLLLFLLFLNQIVYSQFKFQRVINLPYATSNWFVDPVGNYYISDYNKVSKLDSLGRPLFIQAIKAQGEISQLVFNSAQKIISFSEEQQQICFFDNTLTPISSCLALEEFGILNATHVASASQANCIWIYDRINSSIFLFDTDKKIILQNLKNIAGLIGFKGTVSKLFQDSEILWISDGVNSYAFDFNLNFLSAYDFTCSSTQFITDNTLFEFKDDTCFIMELSTREQVIGENPINVVESVLYANGYFYFKKGKNIFVYKIA